MINIVKKGVSRSGSAVLESLVEICGELKVGKHSWELTLFEEEELIPGQRPTGYGLYTRKASVRIQRKSNPLPADASRIRRSLRAMVDAFEPAIVIGPFYEDSKVHCLNVELSVGRQVFASPRDAKWMLLSEDVESIWKLLRENFPELKYRD